MQPSAGERVYNLNEACDFAPMLRKGGFGTTIASTYKLIDGEGYTLVKGTDYTESGRVLIDGVDIAQVEPAWLRRQIGVVLQDSMLFGGTIEENIKIACPNATHEQVAAARTHKQCAEQQK